MPAGKIRLVYDLEKIPYLKPHSQNIARNTLMENKYKLDSQAVYDIGASNLRRGDQMILPYALHIPINVSIYSILVTDLITVHRFSKNTPHVKAFCGDWLEFTDVSNPAEVRFRIIFILFINEYSPCLLILGWFKF